MSGPDSAYGLVHVCPCVGSVVYCVDSCVCVCMCRYMAPQGFPERDIALHAAVLSFPHPVKARGTVVCVASVPAHWASRYSEEVVSEINTLCSEVTHSVEESVE